MRALVVLDRHACEIGEETERLKLDGRDTFKGEKLDCAARPTGDVDRKAHHRYPPSPSRLCPVAYAAIGGNVLDDLRLPRFYHLAYHTTVPGLCGGLR